ncbi:MAG: Serine/threonine protein kinase PrkC, regulator of stationary phase [Myxococcales bacterium]|nr:Serine/threonine protein kinase PrkC, regulator of stationary phase [Myxococcales bacterium]
METAIQEGTVIDGKYRVVKKLAEGGMGTVFVAQHLFLAKTVALKLLHPQLSAQPDAAERFIREARAASAIDHQNIVRVADFGRATDGQLYLVMELLSGQTLARELELSRTLSPTRASFIACQVLRGLEAAHGRGVVHRDLKPENVFISPSHDGGDDVVKLLDFGIAHVAPRADDPGRLTKDGAIMGTPLYMAPEQLKGLLDLDRRCDLYAVGVMLYEMLAGRTPYGGNTFGQIAHGILDGKAQPLREVAPAVDEVLSALVMKSFALDRERRFESAALMRAALERHRVGEPLGGTPPSPYAMPRHSQLGDLPDPDGATVRQRREHPPASPPAAGGPTLDGNDLTLMPLSAETVPPRRHAPRSAPLVLDDSEKALELDLPPPAPTTPPPAPARGGGRAALAALVLVVIALGGGAAWWFVAHPPGDGSLPAPSDRVQVRIADLPRSAKVFLDGAPSPASFVIAGARVTHRVRIEAPGYTDKVLLFTPDVDQTLDGHMNRSR